MLGALLIIYILTGCGDYGSDSHSVATDNYLIRGGHRTVTLDDFNKAFEIVRAAYSHKALKKKDLCRDAKYRLLSELTEQTVILERADELNIVISDSELDEAIARIKGDYEDDFFEKILLERAISYNLWKKELSNRLLIEKVVKEELKKNIAITSEDISSYYEKYYSGDIGKVDLKSDRDLNEKIVRQVRIKKIEEAYKPWIDSLRKRYPVKINKKEWDKING